LISGCNKPRARNSSSGRTIDSDSPQSFSSSSTGRFLSIDVEDDGLEDEFDDDDDGC
jgi:hypothetical protein